jgi:tRNA-specific 2-thiouridylase
MNVARRVVVAMSGGVDSSAAAYLLHAQGYAVIGIGLRLPQLAHGDGGACCGITGMEDASRVAAQIGIPFYVLNYERRFTEAVIDPFCRAYAAGQTPNPCVDCNTRIKFGALLDTALALDADYVATGHYARLVHDAPDARPRLLRSADLNQDQTYFLWGIPAERLTHTLFPLGALSKGQVRQIAAGVGLHVAEKPGSQDICFLQGGSYRDFLLVRSPAAFRPGAIRDARGNILGAHSGVATYTIGQRKGLRLAAGQPMYVQGIDAVQAAIIVGPRAASQDTLAVGQVNWLAGALPTEGQRLAVQTRYRSASAFAHVTPRPGGGLLARYETPQPPAAPGQSAVFYAGDEVVGGGVIESPEI